MSRYDDPYTRISDLERLIEKVERRAEQAEAEVEKLKDQLAEALRMDRSEYDEAQVAPPEEKQPPEHIDQGEFRADGTPRPAWERWPNGAPT